MSEDGKRLCIDLGYGEGGASAAFKDAGYQVVGIDLQRRFKPTIQADYSHLPLRPHLKPKVLLAAPDCSKTSVASIGRYWNPDGTPKPETQKAIDTMRRMRDEAKALEPDYGVIEQPTCMSRRPEVFGKPDHTIRMSDHGATYKKLTDLWEIGKKRIAFGMVESFNGWEKAHRGAKTGLEGVKSKSMRAKWPYGLSKAILEAVE